MLREFSFLHVADIHLGRPFADLSHSAYSNLDFSISENAFNNVINVAIEKKVNFILIAGDSFDSNLNDFHLKQVFINGLKKLADNGIYSYIICGNHDPIEDYKKYSTYFDFEDKYKDLINITGVTTKDFKYVYNYDNLVKIHSISFVKDSAENPCNYLKELDFENKKVFNIGLLHCDLDKTQSKYAPCSRQELRTLGYNYYALGHIHTPNYSDRDFVYSGTIQGHTKKEDAEHGCVYVKVIDNNISELEFIEADCVRFLSLVIDCSDCINKLQVFEKIKSNLKDLRNQKVENFLVEVNLIGVCEASVELKMNDDILVEYNSEYNDFKIQVYEINDFTTPKIDEKELLYDNGIVGIISNKCNENFSENIDDIYLSLVERHKNIYKDLDLSYEDEKMLLESLNDDKDLILEKIKVKLKTLCCEIYKG